MLVATLALTVWLATSVQAQHHNYVLSDHFIERLNDANSTWTAGRKYVDCLSIREYQY